MIDLWGPAVRQLHRPGVFRGRSSHCYIAHSFNNSDTFPDAKVSVEQRDIHLHKLIVANGSEVLARRWGPSWGGSKDTLVLDELLSCHECSITPSHGAALMFFRSFYTTGIKWPEESPDMASALELLPHGICTGRAISDV